MGVKAGVESMYIRRRSGDGAKKGGGADNERERLLTLRARSRWSTC